MRLYKDSRVKDVQPKYVDREIAKGWSRTPPKPSRRTRRDELPDEPSGDVSDSEGDS